MDTAEIADHAAMVRGTLETLGPRPRDRIALMLQGLGLSTTDAEEVLEYGLRSGLLAADDAGLLRALPRQG